ncbi:HIRA [Cordylochernes scorpioides]|uniref:Protein HIRA n=1 Tax=Cordylochernes scorpioides TaxID=51811 RepID=A0ABY6LCM7_9ARAC|nr:HIRA [Cordylochernes scorpioides]
MKFLKPGWVSHKGESICSVDIHPDGTKFATGGLGPNKGMLAIWNMAPLLSRKNRKNKNIPKLLFKMDQDCVNVVRWSHSGEYLAAGGLDHIAIWHRSEKPGDAMFGSNGVNVENWKIISYLRGHSEDIIDLAWSPCDNWLATGGVDNTIVIWNTHKWQEITAVLKGHTGMVKGVIWDPMGQYLASQSDDGSLRVWRTKDWQLETSLTEPFANCLDSNFVSRLGWSPDGLHLVSAKANNSGPVAKIVERDGWKINKDFVGHRAPISCVKFNPNILSNATNNHFCCCAIGSNDKSISIWLSYLKRPLVVLKRIFAGAVHDITWNRQGTQMIACSYDGTIACLNFPEKEIGRAISAEDKTLFQKKYYSPELLQQEQHKKEVLQTSTTENNSPSQTPSQMTKNIQKETRMQDGRRRITPFSIPKDKMNGSKSDISMPPKSLANSQTLQNFNPVEQKTSPKPATIDVETQDNLSQASSTSDGVSTAPVKRKLEQLQGKNKRPRMLNPTTTYSDDSEDSSNSLLPAPRIDQTSRIHLPKIKGKTLEIKNGILLQPGKQAHRLRCLDSVAGTLQWEIVFSSRISLVKYSSSQIAVCCENGTLSVLSPQGLRLKPPIVLQGQASLLSCNNHLVVVATTEDVLSLWDFKRNITIIKNEPILPIIQSSSNCKVNSLKVTKKGVPIITLNTGNAYAYDNKFLSWHQVGEDPLIQSSKIQSLLPPPDSDKPLASTQSYLYKETNTSTTYNDMTQPCTVSFLESQLVSAKTLRSKKEFHYWLISLVRYLVKEDMELRLRDIVNELLSPNAHWKPEVLGLQTHNLFEEILQIMESNVKLQNLYLEYKIKLEQL